MSEFEGGDVPDVRSIGEHRYCNHIVELSDLPW